MGVFWIEFLFQESSWIIFIVFTTIAMELNLMTHCVCGIGTSPFFPVDMQNDKIHTSFINQGQNVPVAIIPIQ